MEDLCSFILSLYEASIQLWRTEEKCRLKVKSIEDIEKSIIQVDIENKELEKQLHDTKLRIIEVRDNIVSIDRFAISFYETLAHLEVQHNKKEFSINKSRNDYELQIFIRMELYQKEEDRINSMPEINELIIADSELKSIKLEYEQLLIQQKHLAEKITKAKNENSKSLNDIIIKFATVYVEMISLNKINEHSTAQLRKLETEYCEKMKIKNSLLQSQKKKNNKVSFWTHNICPLKLNIDKNLGSLNQDLKSNFIHKNISYQQKLENKHSKLNNKPKKNVTFFLSAEDKISDSDNLNDCNSSKINLEESNSNISNNETFTNLALIKSINNINVNTDTFSTNNSQLNNLYSDNNEKVIDECDSYFQTNKRKIIESQPHFEFKKPHYPVHDIDKNSIHTKPIKPSTTNKHVHFENDFIINQEKVKLLNTSMNHYSHNKDSDFHNDNTIQGTNALEPIKNSILIKNNSDSINMYDQTLQFNGIPSQEQNTILSGLFWNDCGEQESENSINTSFYGSDVSELFGTSCDTNHSQFPDAQLNFLNTFNSNLELTCRSNVHKSENIEPNKSGNILQHINEESSKKLNMNSNISTNEKTSRVTNDFMMQPIRPHFGSSAAEQFRLIFNNNFN